MHESPQNDVEQTTDADLALRPLAAAGDPVRLADAYAYPPGGPWLRANMIASVDGAAARDDRAGGLGNETDRRLLSLLRGLADVVIVGAGTVRAEGYGPVRPGPGGWEKLRADRPPVPPLAIVSRRLDLDLDAPVFTDADPAARTILLTTRTAPPGRVRAAAERAEVIVAGEDRLDFAAAVAELVARGHERLLCEGGPRVLAQVVATGVLDEMCLTVSPMLLSGGAFRILNGPAVPVPPRLRLAAAYQDDEDFLFLRYVRRG
ncbi:pyrimidine reductase family protein [Actinomadura miaoliensis]|uniref:Pyrimidine reductase family protein n=1 Tax=Actinomadura miaoliensis TaxID=430685 RepID=A0ABP7WU59_9ACTN